MRQSNCSIEDRSAITSSGPGSKLTQSEFLSIGVLVVGNVMYRMEGLLQIDHIAQDKIPSFEAVVREGLSNEKSEWGEQIKFCRQDECLKPWLELFPREQILVIKSAEMFAEPQIVFERVLRFIGVPDFKPKNYTRVHGSRDTLEMGDQARKLLEDYCRPHRAALQKLVGFMV